MYKYIVTYNFIFKWWDIFAL